MNTNFDSQKAFKEIAEEITELHAKKNDNYGNSFSKLFDELGEISGLVPLYNKLDRLTTLVRGNKNYFESKEDTLKDLASYAIMMLVELKRQKTEETSDVSICSTNEVEIAPTRSLGL
jgi:hypothetical protein